MKKTPMVTIYRGGKRIETYTDGTHHITGR